jgi:hypothetical protein
MGKISGSGLKRLRALCDRGLDERTPEPERITCLVILAKEVKKLLFADGPVAPAPAPSPQTVVSATPGAHVVFEDGRVYFSGQHGNIPIVVEDDGDDDWVVDDEGD